MAVSPYNTLASTSTPTQAIRFTANYADILDTFNLHYKSSEYYFQVGTPHSTRNWIISLSVIKTQLPELIALVVPLLMEGNIPFGVIRNKVMAGLALDGNLGAEHLGKMICIYPPTPQDALILAKKLIDLTKYFKGPAIRTDRCLGGIVYTSWGAQMTVPFSLPPHIIWPFSEITAPELPRKPKLLNFAYYPTSMIKADAKGDVIKALYFKKLWEIKSCIIKQGRQNMFMDNVGRDIRNRLQWQYEMYSQLANDIPLPKIFDYFVEGEDTYLAMQYINGITLTQYLNKVYNQRLWYELLPDQQLEVIDLLLNILRIIQRLHNKGYIHRDITTENFLLDKNNKIWLIDVELMWSVKSRQPVPPFALGTPGYISPEQQRKETPTEKEDIYAIGALMIAFFTSLMAVKFQQRSGDTLKRNMRFFIQNELIASLISDCLEIRPTDRPNLASIISTVDLFRYEVHQYTKHISPRQTDSACHLHDKELRQVIQSAINGLLIPSALNPDNLWVSRVPTESKAMGNEYLGITVREGWYRGVAGPLWLLALARPLGFDIKRCMVAYDKNWDHIQSSYFLKKSSNKTFYEGGAGIALALTEGLHSGMLNPDAQHIQSLVQCFSKDPVFLTLAEGIAGQGIGVLYASRWMDPKYTEELLSSYITNLITKQHTNGAWPLPTLARKSGSSIFGLNRGMAGIIWFLLAYLQKKPDPAVRAAVIKALNWLIKKVSKKGKILSWSDFQDNASWSSKKGTSDIALVFLKSYQVLKIDIYREIAEGILSTFRERSVIMNFTLGSGLAGIGELYLEAYKVLNEPTWLTRAEWIARLLLCTLHIESEDSACWLPDHHSDFTADLFLGNSGIIHFLIRYSLPNKLSHPLDPIHNTN
jgi:serine/threonine protein kinase